MEHLETIPEGTLDSSTLIVSQPDEAERDASRTRQELPIFAVSSSFMHLDAAFNSGSDAGSDAESDHDIDFIPNQIRTLYKNPGGNELVFKCRRGIERSYLKLSKRGLQVTSRVANPCVKADLSESLTQSPTKDSPRKQVTKLQQKILKNEFRGSKNKYSNNEAHRSTGWDGISAIITVRRTFLETDFAVELTTGNTIKVLVKKSIIDALIQCVKAFYTNANGGLVPHKVYEKPSATPTINTVSPRWETALPSSPTMVKWASSPALGTVDVRDETPAEDRCNPKDYGLFSMCQKKTVEESEEAPCVPLRTPLSFHVENDPKAPVREYCPSCMKPRGSNLSRLTKAKYTMPSYGESIDMYGSDLNLKSLNWLVAPKKIEKEIGLPLDVLSKYMIFNKPLPSKRLEGLADPEKDLGGLQALVYSGDKEGEKPLKWPITGSGANGCVGNAPFSKEVEDAISGNGPIIKMTPETVGAHRRNVQMTTAHPLPDNTFVNRVISFLPAIPVETDAFESLNIVHASPDLVVLDWVELMMMHRDKDGDSTPFETSGSMPTWPLYGGMNPFYRTVLQSTKGNKASLECSCTTQLSNGLAFLYNDEILFHRLTDMHRPKGWNYSSSVTGTTFSLVVHIVGKQEYLDTQTALKSMLTDECEYLTCTSAEERSQAMRPLAGGAPPPTPEPSMEEQAFPDSPLPTSRKSKGVTIAATKAAAVKRETFDAYSLFTDAEKQGLISDEAMFEGKWTTVRTSDGLDACMKALGISYVKRKALGTTAFQNVIEFGANGDTTIKGIYPLGITKSAIFPMDGSRHVIDDDTKGSLTCHTYMEDGIWLSHRTAATGMMYDNRIIYEKDPKGSITGPVMLFRFCWKDSTGEYIIDRWMEKTKDSGGSGNKPTTVAALIGRPEEKGLSESVSFGVTFGESTDTSPAISPRNILGMHNDQMKRRRTRLFEENVKILDDDSKLAVKSDLTNSQYVMFCVIYFTVFALIARFLLNEIIKEFIY